MATAEESDVGLGLGLVFGVLSLAGAGYLLAAPDQVSAAWGFALAVTTGVLAVAALHI